MMSTDNQSSDKGVLIGHTVIDILQQKVRLKKELIQLRKLNQNENRQQILEDKISEYDEYLHQHRLQK